MVNSVELLAFLSEKALERPSAALVRLKEGHIDEHVGSLFVRQLLLCPRGNLLDGSGQVRSLAGVSRQTQHPSNAGPDRAILREHLRACHPRAPPVLPTWAARQHIKLQAGWSRAP